jgi:uncharacterized membrane protein required for colicin V production
MLLDLLIAPPMLFFTLFGLRDGFVRKLVAILLMCVGLLVGQLFMNDLAQLFVENELVQAADAPLYAYLSIFLLVAVLQWLLYKFLARNYRIGGFLDRVGGIVFGFMEGAVFLSCLFYIFARTGFPSYDLRRDSMFYKPIVNIAPQILDLTSFIETESADKIKQMQQDRPKRGERIKTGNDAIDTSAVMDEAKQTEHLNKARESYRKKNP